jgi:hypothetical protein
MLWGGSHSLAELEQPLFAHTVVSMTEALEMRGLLPGGAGEHERQQPSPEEEASQMARPPRREK